MTQALKIQLPSSGTPRIAFIGSASKWKALVIALPTPSTRAASIALQMAGKIELLTQRRVEERLAIYLTSRAGGGIDSAGHTIHLSEPKNLVAAQCGTAPEVLSRTFKRLEEDEILVVEKNTVRILDPAAFNQLAEWIED